MISLHPLVSIIINNYNYGRFLAEAIQSALDKSYHHTEIIVVDDGSQDGTAAIVREQFPDVRLISYRTNRGKGYAVKTGMLSAGGRYRLFYDADGSTPITETEKLWPQFEAGADIVIGSRALPDSDIAIHQPWLRENMGRVFNMILRLAGLTSFLDTQCGFKAFTANAADMLFPTLHIDGFGFDVELLHLAEHAGLRIDEIPVRWLNSDDSRVGMFYDAARMLRDAIAIKWRSATRR